MKRIGLLCFLSILFLAAIFHQAVFSWLAHWSLHAYTVSKWGQPLRYDTLYLENQHLVLIHPHFDDPLLFTAEKMTLAFHPNWHTRQLQVEIGLDQPRWHLQTPLPSKEKKWKTWWGREGKWLKVQPHFSVQKGLLSWTQNDQSSHQFCFDLQANQQEGGFVQLHFNPDHLETNCLTLHALSTPHDMKVACDFQRVDCPSLMALMQLLELNVASWSVSSGSLQGHLQASFSDQQKPSFEGELLIEHLGFSQLTTQLNGQVEQALLKMGQPHFNSSVKGQLTILKPASLTYSSPHQEWVLDHILGRVTLDDAKSAQIDLEAQGENLQGRSQWNLQGIAHLDAQRSLNLDLTLFCSSLGHPDGQVHLLLHQLNEGYKQAEIQLNQLSHAECDFLQTLLATYWPVFNEVKLEQGELTARVEVELTPQGLELLHIKQFHVQGLSSTLKPWHVKAYCEQVRGEGKICLADADPWNSLQAEWYIEKGKVCLEEMRPSLPLTDIQAHVRIEQGRLQHSLVTLQLAGLKGVMDIEWDNTKEFLNFKLKGKTQDLAEFLPDRLQEGLKRNFYDNQLLILATLTRRHQQFELNGTLHVQRTQTDQMDHIHFGCELRQFHHLSAIKIVPCGWFYAHSLPLDKFLSSFIFGDDTLSMQGDAEIKGSFDEQFLVLKYDAKNLKIENDYLVIEAKNLRSTIPGQLLGFHQINLHTHAHQGILPIQHVSYFDKKSGLLFQDMQGMVSFDLDKVHISRLEAFCEGIYFSGALDFDYSDPAPGIFNLNIQCPTVVGKLSHIQQLLTHLNENSLLHKIPLEGEIATKGEGLKLHFSFLPQDYHVQASIQGVMSEGSLVLESADMALKGIYMDIDYQQQHQQQLLELTDIQGTLLVGKPRRVEEYVCTGQHIRFSHLADPTLSIDIAVRDQEKELFRLVGNTSEIEVGLKEIYLDPQHSHVSCLHPHHWKCQLKDWTTLSQLEFHSEFAIGQLLRDVQQFRQTGLGCLSPHLIERLTQLLPLEGQGSFLLNYDALDQSYHYQLTADHLQQGGSSHEGFVKGRKQDKKWVIDQLSWDGWNVYAELQQSEEKWKIPFLGISKEQSVLIGLEGDFYPDQDLLKAKLNLCEVNLAQLDSWKACQDFVRRWQPKGYLKVTGEFECTSCTSHPWDHLHAHLHADLDELTLKEYTLQFLKPFDIDFQAGKKIFFPHLPLVLLPQQNEGAEPKRHAYDLRQLDLHFVENELHVSAFTQHERCPFQIKGKTSWPDCQQGSCTLIDSNLLSQAVLNNPLQIEWEDHAVQGLVLRCMQGEFSGCFFDLKREEALSQSSEEKAVLMGQVLLDFNRLAPLLTESVAQMIEGLKVGSLYTLSGYFRMKPEWGKTLRETLFFQGRLTSQEPILKGYQVQALQADMHYIPGQLEMQNVGIQDEAGHLEADHLTVSLDRFTDRWVFLMPHLAIKNLRPAFLREVASYSVPSSPALRSLVVKRFELQDFVGELARPKTWQAKGNLHFLNSSRKNLYHPLLSIPAEIILRLGLDPHVLNPVTGFIYFDLQGDRFYLTRFKDVYSEGRGSKFYLAQGPQPSWMDFNGNLFVQIRMKQYNLIFKIAELFTVSIQGNLKKPEYTLQKQPKASKVF